jgi:hypothetical protein
MLQFGPGVWSFMTGAWFENSKGAMCDIDGAVFNVFSVENIKV